MRRVLVAFIALGFFVSDLPSLRAQDLNGLINMMAQAAAQSKKQKKARQAQAAIVVRMQKALTTAGYYNGPLDGSYGPGTQAALDAFLLAWEIDRSGMSDQQLLQVVEERVATGYKSLIEANQGEQLGFPTGREYSAAIKAGFTNYQDFAAAREKGFTSLTEYQEFTASGFVNRTDFLKAKAGGFTTRQDYEDAAAVGISNAVEYQKFQTTGAQAAKTAQDMIDQVADYSKTGHKFAEGLKVAKALSDLKKAIATRRDVEIIPAREALEKQLTSETEFQKFLTDQQKSRELAAAEALGVAVAEGQKISGFIETYLASNPTADGSDQLLETMDSVNKAISAQVLENLTEENNKAKQVIESLKLSPALARFSLEPAQLAATGAGEAGADPAAAPQLVVNDKNRDLLTGDSGDTLILFNRTGKAPHAIINLLGEKVFDQDQATVCWHQTVPERDLGVTLAYKALNAAKVSEMQIAGSCDANDLMAYDIIMVKRGELLKSELLYAHALVTSYEAQEYVVFATVTRDEVDKETTKRNTLAAIIDEELAKGSREGYGLIIFPGGKPALCSSAGADERVHTALIGQSADEITDQLGGSFEILSMNAEQAFSSIQRKNCGAFYGPAADMAKVLAGARNIGLEARIHPIWFSPEDVEAEKARLTAEDKRKAEAQAKLDQQMELQKSEKAAQDEANQVAATEKQKSLRATFGTAAKAFLDQTLNATAAHVAELKGAEPDGWFDDVFPEVTAFLRGQMQKGWEVDEYRVDLIDYGLTTWEGRSVPGGATSFNIKLRNRDAGTYADHCFLLAYVDDAEFQRIRNGFEAECDGGEGALQGWMDGATFNSQWVVPGARE